MQYDLVAFSLRETEKLQQKPPKIGWHYGWDHGSHQRAWVCSVAPPVTSYMTSTKWPGLTLSKIHQLNQKNNSIYLTVVFFFKS